MDRIIHTVNILEHTIYSSDPCLPDVLSFLYRLHCLDICNPKIERCINKIQDIFITDAVNAENQYEMVLSMIQMTVIYKNIEETTRRQISQILHNISQTGVLSENIDMTGVLFWLLRCKRIIQQTDIFSDLLPQYGMLIDKYTKQAINKDNMSLKGCAGIALAAMTSSGKIDNRWLDLFG